LELAQVRKPIRQLRRLLKNIASDPPMQDVHNLRVRARNVEALAAAFFPEERKCKRQLLKALKPVLKASGEVRDMDVLATKARTLSGDRQEESVTRLVARLQAMRLESAGALVEAVARQRKDARRSLKRLSREIEGQFRETSPDAAGGAAVLESYGDAEAKAIDELSRWPALSKENLHAFRIKVKELRNALRLRGDANRPFVSALEGVKAEIGEWHDWQGLKEIANRVLDAGEDRAVLERIEEIEGSSFKEALGVADAMRRRYLGGYGEFVMAEP